MRGGASIRGCIYCTGKGINTGGSSCHSPEVGRGGRGQLLPAPKGASETPLLHFAAFSSRVLLREQSVHSQGQAPEATVIAQPPSSCSNYPVSSLLGESLGCRRQARGPSVALKPGAVPESQELCIAAPPRQLRLLCCRSGIPLPVGSADFCSFLLQHFCHSEVLSGCWG